MAHGIGSAPLNILQRAEAYVSVLARERVGLSEARWETLKQFCIYILVGVANTGFGYLMYFLAIRAGLVPRVALVVSTSLGVAFNYFTTGRVVFRNKSWSPFLKYLLVQVAIYFGNVALLEWLIRIGLGPLAAQALCIPMVVLGGYLLLRFLVFRNVRA